jgi:antitoxin (DNA-binding transcriptional repressor) of toxin-antitoxin stability system
MQTVAVEKAQAAVPELLKQVAEGEEFTITQNAQPDANLSAATPQSGAQARTGSLPGGIWLPDAAVKESRDRVSTALGNSGFKVPMRRSTINLAPCQEPRRRPAPYLGLLATQ